MQQRPPAMLAQAVQAALERSGFTPEQATAVVADFGAFSVPAGAVAERLGSLQRCTGATPKQLADMLDVSPTLLEMDSDLVTYIARSLRGAVPPCTPPLIDSQASIQEHNRSRLSVKHDRHP